MGRTVSFAPGYAPDFEEFDPLIDDFVSAERTYRHFDRPLSDVDRSAIRASDATILANSFWPLLAFKKVERRVSRDKRSRELRFKEKIREIKFCSHQDAALLERYTSWLSTKYEAFLGAQEFGPTVLAYRRGVGNNISQAKMLFEEIREKREVTAIGLDISGFFDHIRHSVLLDGLHKVLGVDRLNLADHKIYKRMTNFEWVEASKIDERLRGAPRDPGRICNAYQFRRFIRTKVDNLVEVNHADYGIPQGTPLSGLYANISMIDFDEHMHAHFSYIGASYRRYSDDIAIVIPAGIDVAEQVDFVKSYLSGMGLALSAAKTDISTFKFSSGALASDKPFQYLGFTFDGKKILIRQSSLNRYYAKMKSGVVAKVIAAKRKGVPSDSIYMRELFRKYTHFGKHRNFPRYVYRASSELGSPEMRAQIANHFEIFKEVTRITVDSVYS